MSQSFWRIPIALNQDYSVFAKVFSLLTLGAHLRRQYAADYRPFYFSFTLFITCKS